MRSPAFAWRTFWIALALTLVACATFWRLVPPRYDTSDDVTIRLSLEGRFVPGQPATGYVVLSHAALGWTLQALRQAFPSVPWWDVVVATTLIWAMAVMLALSWTALGPDWLGRTAAVAVLLVVFMPLLVKFQYTVSAIVAGGAALILLFAELTGPHRRRLPVLAFGLALLILATLLRPMAAAAGVATACVLLAPAAIGAHGRGAVTRITALSALGALALLLYAGVTSSDRWMYRSAPRWQEYARYTAMMASLFEWGGELSGEQTQAMRAAARWSDNDWDMLPGMWGVDAELHGFDRVSRAYEMSAAFAGGTAEAVERLLARAMELVRSNLARVIVESAYPLAAMLILAVAFADRRGMMAAAAVFVLYCGLCVGIEAAFKELPFRVIAPLQACLAAVALAMTASFRRPMSPAWQVLALGGVLAILAQQTAALSAAVRAELQHTRQIQAEVLELWELEPSLVVRHSDAFPTEYWWRPFHRPDLELPWVALGWNNQHPLLQQFLTATGRQPLLAAICRDPSALVIARPDRLEAVTTYMRERHGEAVTWARVNSGSFAAWRCVR